MRFTYSGCMLLAQLIACACHCQSYFSSNNNPEPELLWEIGAAAGVVNCLTDVGGGNGSGKKFIKDINWNQTQFCAGLFASATWQSRFAVRLQATMGQVSGNDQVLKNASESDKARSRYQRNLQFKTSFTELALVTEWHLRSFLFPNREPSKFSPYLLAGIGMFYYNPQAQLNNIWVDLRPLHTEGQGFAEYPDRLPYKTFSWCVPAGAGIKYDASGLINLRFEIAYRFTGTDYLDDVSTSYIDASLFEKYLSPTQAAIAVKLADRSNELSNGFTNKKDNIRGNPSNKDAWFSCMLTMSIALGRIARK